jgi:ATP-dependent RNA helicase DeaD
MELIEQYQEEHNIPALEIAAALARLLQGDTPLLLQGKPPRRPDTASPATTAERRTRKTTDTRPPGTPPEERKPRREKTLSAAPPEADMERFRIEVGHDHNVKPANIVGAIAGETGLDSKHIGRIDIHADYSLVDLPRDMPRDIFKTLKKVWVSGQQLRITRADKRDQPGFPAARGKKPGNKVRPPLQGGAKNQHKHSDKKKARKGPTGPK